MVFAQGVLAGVAVAVIYAVILTTISLAECRTAHDGNTCAIKIQLTDD
jgi:hypothetical protein